VPQWPPAFRSVLPEDRGRLAEALASARQGRGAFSEEFRVADADGSTRWMAAFGRLQPDERASTLLGVALDITVRKQAELEREAALASAREAQRSAEQAAYMKDEFLAVLSHELRTPMSAMMGWLHLLKTGRLSADEQRKALETVERNARVQTQVIDDLLDVSRIVAGKMELDKAPLALDAALDAVIGSARPGAAAGGIEIVRDFAPGDWTLLGNAGRMHQIFANLLSNAIKFSPAGSRVDVRLAREADGSARVEVVDHGEGIAAEDLQRIFERFRQADSSSRRRHGGLGLGLAIVRSLVELHGGRVEARSEGPGRGACFIVRLPLYGAAIGAPAARRASASNGNLHGTRVLVVDDDESNREMVAKLLRLEDAVVATASGHATAMATCEAWRPDLLVLDIGMPEMDGYELLPKLRGRLSARPAELPAVALSGFAAKVDVARSLAAGFQAHLAKPFDVGELKELLVRLRPV
jgi:signal transduction histidine kinase